MQTDSLNLKNNCLYHGVNVLSQIRFPASAVIIFNFIGTLMFTFCTAVFVC